MTRPTHSFLSHLLAYGASEAAAKLSRLGVVIVVARTLDVTEIGLAAAALATGDLLKSLTENGIGQRIVAAPEAELDATCNRAHGLFTAWCLGLFTLQCGLAAGIWAVTGNAALAGMIALLGAEYLFMPAGLVQVALALRAGKMHRTAAIAGGQAVCANLASVLLALVIPSALALVLPRLLSAPVWLIAVRRLHPWQARPEAGLAPIRPFAHFGAPILGTELVRTARLHADKLLIGALLGPEMLGLYFLAFNAGLSLATSFSTAFAAVLFPHLCARTDRAEALRQGIGLSVGLVAPVVIAQSLLAPWYVPLLLGPGWEEVTTPVSILCMAAIPTMLWTATAGWLRAGMRPLEELRGTAILAAATLAGTALAAPYGLTAIAWTYLATACCAMTVLSLPALRFALLPEKA